MTNLAYYIFGGLALFFSGFFWSIQIGGGISLLIVGFSLLLILKDKADKYENTKR